MSDSQSPKSLCYLHLTFLKYDLAGDMESAIHLQDLEERYNAINWDDPDFIRYTSEMRSGIPVSLDGSPSFDFYAAVMLNMVEQRAAMLEMMSQVMVVMDASTKEIDRTCRYLVELKRVSSEMSDQLEALGATPPTLPDPETI